MVPALRQMAVSRPTSEAEFLSLSGVGAKKLESYGEVFLRAIEQWLDQGEP